MGKKNNQKHGLSNTRIYGILSDMKKRCYNENSDAYKYYGGRGIRVCSEWLGENGIVNFYNWAMNNGYEDHLTIERIDVDGNYDPNNCKWATIEEQNKNKTNKHSVTINGETKSVAEWSEISGVAHDTLLFRIKSGWKNEKLLNPVRMSGKQSGIKGITWDLKSQKWKVCKSGKFLGLYKDLNYAIKVQNGIVKKTERHKAKKQSGVNGIYWKEKSGKWEVYNGKRYIGSYYELDKAVQVKKELAEVSG